MSLYKGSDSPDILLTFEKKLGNSESHTYNKKLNINTHGQAVWRYNYHFKSNTHILYLDIIAYGERHSYAKLNTLDCSFIESDEKEYQYALDSLQLDHFLEKTGKTLYIPKIPFKASYDVSKILSEAEKSDFNIVVEHTTIPVHSLVLETYWPYFKSVMENDCSESNEKTLKLDYPLVWVKLLIS